MVLTQFYLQAAVPFWNLIFPYILYGVTAVTLVVVFFVLRRKDDSSPDFDSSTEP